MPQDVYEAVWMEATPIGADFPHPEVAAVTFGFFSCSDFSNIQRGRRRRRRRERMEVSLFRILLLLQASSHFHPFPPSPTPDSSLYCCSHISHNAPVIITPTPVYLQPVARRGASLSLSFCLSTSLSSSSSFSLLPVFPQLSFSFFSVMSSVFLYLSSTTQFSIVFHCLYSIFTEVTLKLVN